MKRILKINSLILVMVLMFNVLFPVLSMAAEEIVTITFQDEELYNEIKGQIPDYSFGGGVGDDSTKTITFNVEDVTTLSISNDNISDITFLSKFTKLNDLSLSGNKISDISALSTLTNLKELRLSGNEINNISPLASLTNLEYLYLKGNKTSDISALANLTKLKDLIISETEISNISALSNLTNLEKLTLNKNKISDISSLATLTKLEWLELDENEISNISPLSKLTNLIYLSLNENKISDISSLSTLTKLDILSINNNEISNISALSTLTDLTELYLNENEISDVSSLSTLTKLKNVSLAQNKISDVKTLFELGLWTLNLEDNEISNLPKSFTFTTKNESAGIEEALYPLKHLNLSKNKISDISMFAETPVMTSLEHLDLSENEISNIIYLKNSNKLTKLLLNKNKIKDISVLSSKTDKGEEILGNLVWLNLSENEITDISSLPMLKNEIADGQVSNSVTSELYLNKNKIQDISRFAELEGDIDMKLDLSENAITDISPVEGKTFKYLNIQKQKIEIEKTTREEIKLPKIFIQAKDTDSVAYTDDELILEGCTLNSDKTAIIWGKDITVAKVKLFKNEGERKGVAWSEFIVKFMDIVPPEVNVEYSTTVSTNKNVKVTIKANEPLQGKEGWVLSDYKLKLTKEYSKNTEEKLAIYDLAGNKRDIEIKVSNIDKVAPQVEVEYSTTEKTKGTVSVTVKANEKIQQLEGWSLNGDSKTLTKTYTKNEQEEITVKDLAGNEKKVNITVNNIADSTAPQIDIRYSTTESTNKNVTVIVRANEEIQEVQGWNLLADRLTLTKEYSQNSEEEITIQDLEGNEKVIPIKIQNIDKTLPKAQVEYSTTELTNGVVKAKIRVNEKVQQLEGWSLDEEAKTLTKTYTKNEQEEIRVKDLAGNEIKVNVSVQNIDITIPKVEIQYSTTNKMTDKVTVTLTANEIIQKVEGWTLSSDKQILTKVYIKNAEEQITIKDLAGNGRKISVKISNIGKESQKEEGNKENNKGDNTIAGGEIPQAGQNIIVVISILTIMVFVVVSCIKLRKFKDVR